MIEWLVQNLSIAETSEALHLATLLCCHGYIFPVPDMRWLHVKDDSSLYRFQVNAAASA